MQATIKLDDRLLQLAKQLSHMQSTEQVVKEALEQYVIRMQSYQRLLALRGQVAFWDDADEANPTT